MAAPTHATVAFFSMDLTMEEAQLRGLHDFIVPSVHSAPGFVTGYWTLDRAASESVAFIVFDSKDAAEALAANVRDNASNQVAVGITLVSIRVVEMTAIAP